MSTFGRAAPVGAACLVFVLARLSGASEPPAPSRERPAFVFVLLDTMRADRIGAFGHASARTPVLDALAASGIRFASHHANAHATRPSMPQLMSGRYYHRSILRDFEVDRHPRELSFLRPDPSAALLPEVVVEAGYQALGASAHPWVVYESAFGRRFERLDLVAADASRGHADAAATVDRALALWDARDHTRPTFLYVHLMDAHMPRSVPSGETPLAIPGYDPTARFGANGEPAFDPRRRRWDRTDASDFTDDDRRWFAAVYDANVAFMDRQLGRLLQAVRAADPGLEHTLIVVTADHGEELGEDGRTDHGDALAEGVQRVPWIMAGDGIPPGQVVTRLTEHVDVLPTVLDRLGVALPPGVRVDGVACLDHGGRPAARCGKPAVYYAWEEYRGVRTARRLLRENRPGSFRARCEGTLRLFDVAPLALTPVDEPARQERLQGRLRRRLDPLQRAYQAPGWTPPAHSVVWPARFWELADEVPVRCASVGPDTARASLGAPGWLWSGRGVAVLHGDHAAPLSVRVPAPDGEYQVEAGAVALEPMPWLFGFGRWTRKSFLRDDPTTWVPLGAWPARHGTLTLPLDEATALDRHVLRLRLTPAGTTPDAAPRPAGDAELRRRLEALGYVQ